MIPVIWATNNPESIARGYWDQGLLEDLLAHRTWRPPGAPEFEHFEVRGGAFPPVADGAVVIVPGRHNAERRHVLWLNAQLQTLGWALVILTGDEAAEFPWQKLDHPRCKVWAMGARPASHQGVDVPLASGYPPWFRTALADAFPAAPDKTLDWLFAGQVTHARRLECAVQLRPLPGGYLYETPGFTQGVAPRTYAELMGAARVAPCPSGPESPDSFRLFEALEAGAVPLADAATPHGPDPSFWTYIFGEPPPFPEVGSWEALPALMAEQLAAGPAEANRVFAWWQGWKRRLAWRLDSALRELGTLPVHQPAEEEITVIVPSSPALLHPSTEHIEETVASIRERLPLAEVLIVVDGVRPEQDARRGAYDEYTRRLLWLCNHRWTNVLPIVLPEWGHQANAARAALAEVRTPLVLFVEHDTPLSGPRIPWASLAAAIHSGSANVIRLHHEGTINPEHAHLMLDPEPVLLGDRLLPDPDPMPCTRTVQWSQRPHLAPTWWYRDLIDRYFAPESRTMIEDVLHGVVQHDWNTQGPPGWERWRLWLYTPEGDMRRSGHLDSRAGEPKFDMRFAYPGRLPGGAPRPTRRHDGG